MTGAGREDRPSFLVDLAQQRDTLLTRIEAELWGDERVVAAWLGGSFGRGTTDEWSDIDLHVVIRNDDVAEWLAERDDLYVHLGHPVMTLPSSASEKGDYQGVLFSGPLFFDLVVHPVSIAERDPDTHLLFERVTVPVRAIADLDGEERQANLQHNLDFFWAMTPIALKYIGRGRTERAVSMIELLSGTFIRLWRLVHDPGRRDAGGASWLHPERDLDLVRLVPRFGTTIDPSVAVEAVARLMEQVRRLHPAVERLRVSIPVEAVAEIERLRDDVTHDVSHQRGMNREVHDRG